MCKDVWFFNDLFAERYMSFGDDSLFFLDSCSSTAPVAANMHNALFGNNLAVFVGWSEPVWVQGGWEIASLFFDRWLGANHMPPVPDPPQRPFDAESVRAELEKLGKDTAPAKGFNAKLTVLPRPGGSKVAGAPSIELIQVKEKDEELKIGGIFGKDPGSDRRKVKLAGEGYIDMNTRKLYLFLVGIGDDSGSGTFNIGNQTTAATSTTSTPTGFM